MALRARLTSVARRAPPARRASCGTVRCDAKTRGLDSLAGAGVALGAAVLLATSVAPGPALAGKIKAKSNADAYADMMKSMPALSAESLYEKGGGACGDGYEMTVEKVIGAKCICVDAAKCDSSRAEMTEYQRAYGKYNEDKSEERGTSEKPPEEEEPSGYGVGATFAI